MSTERYCTGKGGRVLIVPHGILLPGIENNTHTHTYGALRTPPKA